MKNHRIGRIRIYMRKEYDQDYYGNADGRSRIEWANDKAFDDEKCGVQYIKSHYRNSRFRRVKVKEYIRHGR